MYAHDYGNAFYHTTTRAMIGKKSFVGTYISSALHRRQTLEETLLDLRYRRQ